jgi:glycosyltransferase involved in cell wall biosynthesis
MSERCRIGIDGRALGVRPKGIPRYVWELCRGLDMTLPNAEFYLYSRNPTGLPLISTRWHERPDSAWARRMPKSLWAVVRPGFMAREDKIDVFWGGAWLIPLIGLSVRSVLTVHDLVYKVVPETMSTRTRWAMRMFFEPSLSHAHAVLTNSQGTARRLHTLMGYRAHAVVPPGVSSAFQPQTEVKIATVLARHSLRRPYVLGVATLEPRKGLDSLVRAFCRLQSESELSNHTLVLVGERGWRDASLARLINGSGPRINWLGFLDDEELVALYSGCDVFVYPSKYEGFGMPVLEARACGARVVTSDTPELHEAGGNDAIYVTPTEDGIRTGILAAIGSKKKSEFNWHTQSWLSSSAVLASALTGEQISPAQVFSN